MAGREGRKEVTTREYEETLWSGGNLQYFDCDDAYRTTFVKPHRTGHIKTLNFTVCKLNLHILDLKKKRNDPLEKRPKFLKSF